MTSKRLTQEQAQTADKIYYQSGFTGAAVGLGIGLAATLFTIKRSPDFRALSKPLQAVMTAGSKYWYGFTLLKVSCVVDILFYSYHCWFLVC